MQNYNQDDFLLEWFFILYWIILGMWKIKGALYQIVS